MKKPKDLILREFKRSDVIKSSQLASKCGISRQAIHRHLSELVREGRIVKQGSSRRTTSYILNRPSVLSKVWKNQKRFTKKMMVRGLKEDAVLKDMETSAGLLKEFPQRAKTNFKYAFTEMLNNAIDHSRSKFVKVEVSANSGRYSFVVADGGVGIFKNICDKKGLADELEAIQDLTKGKQTTMPERHSGEGIFFTSKIADRFVIESHKKRLTFDNAKGDIFIEDIRFKRGTKVFFEQSSDTRKNLEGLFRQYAGENFKFSKTRVTVKLYTEADLYVSRSEAKRLLHAMENFEEIELDFRGVQTIGQAFADEIFRVFKIEHPEIVIRSVNCNENVEFMIKRAGGG